jgi:hypothetical protein
MTVGVPEISLDTWGLRYVKKKKGDAIDLVGDAPTKSPQFGGGSELDSATANPSGRQNDSSGDTTGVYGSAGGGDAQRSGQKFHPKGERSGKKVGEQVHEHKQEKGNEFGQKKPTHTTSGSPRGEGATHGADTTSSGQGSAGQALTAGTKKNPVTTSAGLEGSKQTHTGSKGYNYGTDPPKSRGGHTIKPAKQGEGSSTKPSKYIQRAVLDLAVIKCKLLKMKTKKKDFIEEGRPTRPAYRKDDDEKEGKEKSNEIVEKAIELINEAYDTMKSSVENSPSENEAGVNLKNVIEDLKETKKAKKEEKETCEECGSSLHEAGYHYNEFGDHDGTPKKTKKADGSTSTGDVGAANFVYSDVHEKKKQDGDDYDDSDDDDESEEEDWDHAARNDDGSLPSSLDKYKDPKVL